MILTGDHWTLHVGDNRAAMATMPDRSVHAVVTSPPYWGLRSYNIPAELKHLEVGGEPTVDQYIAAQLEVFRQVRRVLRDDGICWVNIGDSYATGAGSSHNPGSQAIGARGGQAGKHLYINSYPETQPNRMPQPGLKSGDQCLIPHRFAMAMQADGWYLRDTVIWRKPGPMPSSQAGWRWRKCRIKVAPGSAANNGGIRGIKLIDDRGGWTKDTHPETATPAKWKPCPGCRKCELNGGYVLQQARLRTTTAHEYLFLFSKSDRYFMDLEPWKEIASGKAPGNKTHKGAVAYSNGDGHMRTKVGLTDIGAVERRTPRSVWSISNEGLKEKHYAAFPGMLAYKALLPAISPGGCCVDCGQQYAPVVVSERIPTRPGTNTKVPGRNSRMFQERDPQHSGEYKADRYEEVTGRASAQPDSPYHDHAGTIVGNRDPKRHTTVTKVLEYRKTCNCAAAVSRVVILDPYTGSGTTGRVALHLGADFIGCELSEAYSREIAAPRLNKPWLPKHLRPTKTAKVTKPGKGQRELFT